MKDTFVKVKLTGIGVEVLHRECISYPTIDEKGYAIFSLEDFTSIYRRYIDMHNLETIMDDIRFCTPIKVNNQDQSIQEKSKKVSKKYSEYVYDIVVRNANNRKLLRENFIINLVGAAGLDALIEDGFVNYIGPMLGHNAYYLKEKY